MEPRDPETCDYCENGFIARCSDDTRCMDPLGGCDECRTPCPFCGVIEELD